MLENRIFKALFGHDEFKPHVTDGYTPQRNAAPVFAALAIASNICWLIVYLSRVS